MASTSCWELVSTLESVLASVCRCRRIGGCRCRCGGGCRCRCGGGCRCRCWRGGGCRCRCGGGHWSRGGSRRGCRGSCPGLRRRHGGIRGCGSCLTRCYCRCISGRRGRGDRRGRSWGRSWSGSRRPRLVCRGWRGDDTGICSRRAGRDSPRLSGTGSFRLVGTTDSGSVVSRPRSGHFRGRPFGTTDPLTDSGWSSPTVGSACLEVSRGTDRGVHPTGVSEDAINARTNGSGQENSRDDDECEQSTCRITFRHPITPSRLGARLVVDTVPRSRLLLHWFRVRRVVAVFR